MQENKNANFGVWTKYIQSIYGNCLKDLEINFSILPPPSLLNKIIFFINYFAICPICAIRDKVLFDIGNHHGNVKFLLIFTLSYRKTVNVIIKFYNSRWW